MDYLLYYIVFAIAGLLASYLVNLIVYNLPIWLKQQWLVTCCQHLNIPIAKPPTNKFSFKVHKPYQYPVIEILAIISSLIIFYKFKLTLLCFAALLFNFILITQAVIDAKYVFIPDQITIPGIWIGLLFNTNSLFINIQSAILGAILGYVVLWLFANVFKFFAHKDGMGNGDFKLLAMIGAWLGWQQIPMLIIMASIFGLVFSILAIYLGNRTRASIIPFGPFLAIAGWIALLYGSSINNFYFF